MNGEAAIAVNDEAAIAVNDEAAIAVNDEAAIAVNDEAAIAVNGEARASCLSAHSHTVHCCLWTQSGPPESLALQSTANRRAPAKARTEALCKSTSSE
jgi:hypothetical protein